MPSNPQPELFGAARSLFGPGRLRNSTSRPSPLIFDRSGPLSFPIKNSRLGPAHFTDLTSAGFLSPFSTITCSRPDSCVTKLVSPKASVGRNWVFEIFNSECSLGSAWPGQQNFRSDPVCLTESRGVRNPMKISDIGFLKTEPN